MSDDKRELYFDLLTKKVVTGLDDNEQIQLEEIGENDTADDLRSLEMTAAAINMAGLSLEVPIPAHLYSKIAADADRHLGVGKSKADTSSASTGRIFTSYGIFARPKTRSWFGWLGWVTAAAACIALAFNIWVTRMQPSPGDQAKNPLPVETPRAMTPAEAREDMLRSASGMIKAGWAAGNVKDIKQVTGDVVWSDAKQAGYMRFRGLPVNDPAKETYQLWIFDKAQDKATPIDGGTFDVNTEGEITIPITPKLKTASPEMFAVTMEKPGGVVVSKREKIAAIAKVGTHAS